MQWVATERIEVGALLFEEPAACLHLDGDDDSALSDGSEPGLSPLAVALANELSNGEHATDLLRVMLAFSGEDAAPSTNVVADQFAAVATVERSQAVTLLHVAGQLQRPLSSRWSGEVRTLGVGLFPAHSLCAHSCEPNAAVVGYDVDAGVLVTRAASVIESGEPITISRLEPGTDAVAGARRTALLAAKLGGRACGCAVCAAPRGSPPFVREQSEQGVLCVHGLLQDGHLLVPNDPYVLATEATFMCMACSASVGGAAAHAHVAAVEAALDTLDEPASLGSEDAPE
jgi:hypothetical protein